MKRAIATQTLPGDLGEKIVAAARAGFDGIEIFENDLLYFDRRPAEVRDMCEDVGLEIVSWQPFRDFEALPAASRQKAFDRAERKFDIIGELGTRMMMVCSNVSPQAIDDAGRAAADLFNRSRMSSREEDGVSDLQVLIWTTIVRVSPKMTNMPLRSPAIFRDSPISDPPKLTFCQNIKVSPRINTKDPTHII